MTRKNRQKRLKEYASHNEYIPLDILESYELMVEPNNLKALANTLRNFVSDQCPNCGAVGLFRWRFLGRLNHPSCGWSWYVSHWVYLRRRIETIFRGSKDEIASAKEYALETREESLSWMFQGCLESIVVALLIVVIGIPLSLLLIPVRMIVRLTTSNSRKRVGGNVR